MRFFKAVKEYFDKSGLQRPDFWAIMTMVFALVGIFTGEIAVVGMALFPAFFAGFYLAIDTWTEDPDEDDEDEDEDPLVNFIRDADPAADYQLYA